MNKGFTATIAVFFVHTGLSGTYYEVVRCVCPKRENHRLRRWIFIKFAVCFYDGRLFEAWCKTLTRMLPAFP